MTVPTPRRIYLHPQPDGSFVDWGRHGPARTGAASWYTGEAAEVMALVLKHSRPAAWPPHTSPKELHHGGG